MAPANTALLGRTGLYIHTQEAEGQQQRPRRGCPGLLGGRHRCSHKDRLCSAWPGHGTPAPAHTARLQSTGCASASDRNQLTRKPLAGARCGGVRSRSREMTWTRAGRSLHSRDRVRLGQSTREGPETLQSPNFHIAGFLESKTETVWGRCWA